MIHKSIIILLFFTGLYCNVYAQGYTSAELQNAKNVAFQYYHKLEALSIGDVSQLKAIQKLWETSENSVNNDLVVNGSRIDLRKYLTNLVTNRVKIAVDPNQSFFTFYDKVKRLFAFEIEKKLNNREVLEYIIVSLESRRIKNTLSKLDKSFIIISTPWGEQKKLAEARNRKWKVANQEKLNPANTIQFISKNATFTFSPNDEFIASTSENGDIKIWNTTSGKLFRNLAQNSKWMYGDSSPIRFTDDGKKLLSYSRAFNPRYKYSPSKHKTPEMVVWNIESSEIVDRIKKKEKTTSLKLGDDSQMKLVFNDLKGLEKYEAEKGFLDWYLDDKAWSSPNGNAIVRWKQEVWDSKTRTRISRVPEKYRIRHFSISNDAKYIVVSCTEGKYHRNQVYKIKVWNAYNGTEINLNENFEKYISGNPVGDVDISPKGKYLIAVVGKRLMLFNLENAKLIMAFPGQQERINSVGFSPNGSTVASQSDGFIRLWDVGYFISQYEKENLDDEFNFKKALNR